MTNNSYFFSAEALKKLKRVDLLKLANYYDVPHDLKKKNDNIISEILVKQKQHFEVFSGTPEGVQMSVRVRRIWEASHGVDNS